MSITPIGEFDRYVIDTTPGQTLRFLQREGEEVIMVVTRAKEFKFELPRVPIASMPTSPGETVVMLENVYGPASHAVAWGTTDFGIIFVGN